MSNRKFTKDLYDEDLFATLLQEDEPEQMSDSDMLRIELLELEREKCKTDLFYLCKDILGYPDLSEVPHREMCDYTMSGELRKIQLIPRSHFKSTVTTIGFCVQEIIKNPNIRILLTSARLDNSKSFLREIKGHFETNERLRELFGNHVSAKWTETEIISSQRTPGYNPKESTITLGSMGASMVSKHFDLIIMDDVVNREWVSTPEQIAKTIIYYKDMLDLVEPASKGGRIHITGTRWHYNDLYAWVLEQNKHYKGNEKFRVLIRKAYWEEDGEIKVLFPERYSYDFLQHLRREKGGFEFACQYLNEPVDEENATFRESDFRYYAEEGIDERLGIPYQRLPKQLRRFVLLDPASRVGRKNDYSAIIALGVDSENNWYILDMIRDKMLPEQTISKLFHFCELYKPSVVGIETRGFQLIFESGLRDRMKQTGKFLPIKDLKADYNSKEDRIRGLQPRFQAHSVFFPKTLTYKQYDGKVIDLVVALQDELLKFPVAPHDDVSDCLAYGNQLASAPRAERITEDPTDHMDDREKKVFEHLKNLDRSKKPKRRFITFH
jgi:predicted phage terminase large subunit-like protein